MWSIYPLIMLDTLLLRPSLHFTQLHFTPLHYTFRRFTSSHLNFTQLHFTTPSFGLTPSKFPTAPFHLISLQPISLHFTALLDDRHTLPFVSLLTIPFISVKKVTWHTMFKNYIFILFIVCENPALIFGFIVSFFTISNSSRSKWFV